MKVKRLNAVLILLVLVGVTAGIAAARVNTSQKTTTITFWDAYSTGGGRGAAPREDHHPRLREDAIPGSSSRTPTIPYDNLHHEARDRRRRLPASRPRPLRHHLGAGARQPGRARARSTRSCPTSRRIRRSVVPRAASDELLEGPLLRAAARHEHSHLDLQPGRADRDRRERAAEDVRTAHVDVGAGEGEGLRPLRRERHELLEYLPMDLVERRQHHEQDLHARRPAS